MELQEKFEELFDLYGSSWVDSVSSEKMIDYLPIKEVAKECTKLCLEEQIKLLYLFLDEDEPNPYEIIVTIERNKIFYKLMELQQQLKSLE